MEEGYDVVVGHGSGPQVGMINLAMEFPPTTAAKRRPCCSRVRRHEARATSAITCSRPSQRERRGIDKECASVVTQMVVSKDIAFQKPAKPVGSFYSKEDADKIVAEKGYTFVEDAGRGWRPVVPSLPTRIVELKVVEQLVAAGDVVITVGGGGIPVVETADGLCGVAAVIDKDRSSSKLALDIDADMLVILTAVDACASTSTSPIRKSLPR